MKRIPFLVLPRRRGIVALLLAACAALDLSARLILVGGRGEVGDPGWPAGAAAVAALPSRQSYAEGPPFGGGEWTFFHSGDAAALQAAVDAFAAIRSPGLRIRLHPGHPENPFHGGKDDPAPRRYDWSFTVWVPASWERLAGPKAPAFLSGSADFGGKVPPTTLDVFVHPGGPDWNAVRVPAGIPVTDGRAESRALPPGKLAIETTCRGDAGEPLPGAIVEVRASADSPAVLATAVADAGGVARFSGLEPGDHLVVARATDRVARVAARTRATGDTWVSADVGLARAEEIRGTVKDVSGAGIAGVRVDVRHAVGTDGRWYEAATVPSATSGPDGTFVLHGVPAGRVELHASKDGLHHVWDPRERTVVAPGGAGPEPVLRMKRTGVLRVRAPKASNVFVQEAGRTGVGSWGGSASVDPEGWVEFKGVPEGPYRLSTRPFADDAPAGGGPAVTVKPGDVVEIGLE